MPPGRLRRRTEDDGTAPPPAALSVWTVIGAVAAQSALLTALLYYVGWVRTRAVFGYFGVDDAALQFATPEYLLRGINACVRPLLVVALLVLIGLAGYRGVAGHTARHGPRLAHRLRRCSRAVGAAAGAVALAGLLVTPLGVRLGLVLPALLLLAGGASACAEVLGPRQPAGGRAGHARNLALLVLAGLGALWFIAGTADRGGTSDARAIAAHAADRPEIIVYSRHRLAIAGPGVVVQDVGGSGDDFAYRYTGLHLLVQRKDEYLLLPAPWTRGADAVYRLTTNDGVRIDVRVAGVQP